MSTIHYGDLEKELVSVLIAFPETVKSEEIQSLSRLDFSSEMCGEVFHGIVSLAKEGRDEPWSYLRGRLSEGKDWVRWFEEVSGYATYCDSAKLRRLVQHIRQGAVIRSFQLACERAIEESRNGAAGDAQGFLEDFTKKIQDLQGKIPSGEPEQQWQSATESPILELKELEPLLQQKIEFTIEPLCPRGALTIFQGQPKGGKSAFALLMGLHAVRGEWPDGFGIQAPQKVLFVEFEDGPLLFAHRVDQYMKGIDPGYVGFPDGFFFCDYPALWLDAEKHKKVLIEEIRRRQIDLVIIDTLSHVHQAEDENASAQMKPLMMNLRKIAKETNASILLLHHTAKGSDERSISEKGRGSSAISAGVDAYIDWGDRKDTNVTPVRFRSKFGGNHKFRVEYTPMTGGGVEWAVLPDEKDESASKGHREAVLNATKKACFSSPDGVTIPSIVAIAEPEGVSERAVYRWVAALESEGLLSVGLGSSKKRLVKLILKKNHEIDRQAFDSDK